MEEIEKMGEEERKVVNRYKQAVGMKVPKVFVGAVELAALAKEIMKIKDNDGGKEMTIGEWLTVINA